MCTIVFKTVALPLPRRVTFAPDVEIREFEKDGPSAHAELNQKEGTGDPVTNIGVEKDSEYGQMPLSKSATVDTPLGATASTSGTPALDVPATTSTDPISLEEVSVPTVTRIGSGSFGTIVQIPNDPDHVYKLYPKNMTKEFLHDVAICRQLGFRSPQEAREAHLVYSDAYVRLLVTEQFSLYRGEHYAIRMPAHAPINEKNYKGELRIWLKLMWDVSQAALEIKKRGIMHRDIKPANTLIDRDGTHLLCDWGLATAMDQPAPLPEEEATRHTGNFYFMPPEAFKGTMHVSHDVFSLGVMGYRLWTGSMPFSKTSQNVYARMLYVANGDFATDYDRFRSEIETSGTSSSSDPLHLVLPLMHPDPTQRPSIEAVAEAFERAYQALPQTAGASSSPPS